MPFDERELSKLFNAQNIETFRTIQSKTGSSVTLSLDELQTLILQINDRGAQISQLEIKIQALEMQLNTLRMPSVDPLILKIADIERRLNSMGITNYDQRISDLEKVVM